MNTSTQLQEHGAACRGSDNPLRGRINAVFFDLMDGYMHRKYSALKARLFADLPPEVVELGAGAGANFRYFRPGTKVHAIEPNRHMHAKLAARARRHDVRLTIHAHGAEALALPDASADAVVASLVLCTIADPRAAVRAVLRVLKPGGRFVCIEHVAAPRPSVTGWIQRAVHRPWLWFFEGCHTHRETGALLESAGFSSVTIRPLTLRTVFIPVRPQIAAVCVK